MVVGSANTRGYEEEEDLYRRTKEKVEATSVCSAPLGCPRRCVTAATGNPRSRRHGSRVSATLAVTRPCHALHRLLCSVLAAILYSR